MNANPTSELGKSYAKILLSCIDFSVLENAVRTLSMEFNESNKPGGVIAIATFPTEAGGDDLASASVGEPLKLTTFGYHAHEKLNRLFIQRYNGGQDVASSQSANPKDLDNPTYGGCVFFTDGKGSDIYISFSGAPPEVDEAVVIAIGILMGFTPPNIENKMINRAVELLIGGVRRWERF